MAEHGFDTLTVIGLGYVGLPTAAIFANRGLDVVGVDTNAAVVDKINRGEVHIVEPDLDKIVRDAVASGSLRAATMPEAADAFVIAVPTPFFDADHKPDLGYLMAAALAPTNLTVPASTASGRSVTSRMTRTGLPSEGASSWMPPESVRMKWAGPIR